MKWVLLTVIVICTVLSDVLQSHEMKRSGAQRVNARGLARLLRTVATRRFLILSIVLMAISFFTFMALLQREPLSFAVPASAATFIFETMLAKWVLHEAVGKRRAAGALLVLCGVVLLSR
ncbi:MAG: EamA family transporter [Acidobacteriaceae bacterium]|nr:EamA family transporter [Acidobacteriaceae bacterium]